MTAADIHTSIVGTPGSAPGLISGVLVCKTEDDTHAMAARLASSPAIANSFIELRGELGAGKTTFVRYLLRTLGVDGKIKSPTYAVVEPHESPESPFGALSIWHFDFYRFNDPQEWEDAGFRDIFASAGLKLAEWPDKAASHLPLADLKIDIETMDDDSRQFTLTPQTPPGNLLLKAAVAT